MTRQKYHSWFIVEGTLACTFPTATGPDAWRTLPALAQLCIAGKVSPQATKTKELRAKTDFQNSPQQSRSVLAFVFLIRARIFVKIKFFVNSPRH